MKKRSDLDCIGYLSDVLFEPAGGPMPRFSPAISERNKKVEKNAQRDGGGKLLEFKPGRLALAVSTANGDHAPSAAVAAEVVLGCEPESD
jgi:hypothetical protein